MMKSVVLSLCLGLALTGWGLTFAWGAEEKEPLFDGKQLGDWVLLLKDKDPNNQRAAAAALAKNGKKAGPAVPALLDMLKNDDSAYARQLAAYVLGYVTPEAAKTVPALVEMLQDKDAGMRRAAAGALASLGPASKSAVPELLNLLKAKEPQQRQLAAYILGNVPTDSKEVVIALTLARKDKNEAVRQAVEAALKNLDVGEEGTAAGNDPGGPEQTVAEALRALAEVRPLVLWKDLPASYQKDLQALASDFGNKMDPDVWHRQFALLKKGVAILREKKALVLGKLRQTGVEARAAAQYSAMLDILHAVVNSDLSNLNTFKNGDVEKLISGPMTELLRNLIEIAKSGDSFALEGGGMRLSDWPDKVRRSRVTVLRSEGNQATVAIDWVGAGRTEVVLVKIEGKWIPKPLADTWTANVKQAREAMTAMWANFLKDKAKMLQRLDTLDKKLDQLSAAKTQFEFDLALVEVMKAGMGGEELPKR